MPTRRSHSNSHHGCMQCKQRRVKCDQQQPKCARCVRRNSECTYRHLMTNYNPFQMQEMQQPRRPSSSTPSSMAPVQSGLTRDLRYVFHSPEEAKVSIRATEEPVIKVETPGPLSSKAPPTPFIKTEPTSAPDVLAEAYYPPDPSSSMSNIQVSNIRATGPTSDATVISTPATTFSTELDTFLLHHYTSNLTTPAMSPVLESNIFPFLNSAILQHAQAVPYVLHVVLAFSGLHLASYSSSPESANYLYTALAHKDAALQLFMPAIREGITPQTAEPQLAASIILVACCLALPAADPEGRMSFDRIDILAEVAGLFQGTNHIYHHNAYRDLPRDSSSASSSSSYDSSSPLSQPPKSPGDNVPWIEAMSSLQDCVEALRALSPAANAQEQERRHVLGHAAAKLQRAFGKISESRRDFNVLCVWLGMVDPQFVKLIQQRDPIALLLLAHWAVCRTNMDDIWWARGWPATAVDAIFGALDDRYRPLLGWCLSQARGRASSTGQQQLVEHQTAHLQYAR